MTCVI